MSDGPHRTLRMRADWKKFAKFADNKACTPEEVASAAEPALAQDWNGEIPKALADTICEVFDDEQRTLFSDQKILQLTALKAMTAGHELGDLFVDCAVQAAANGACGTEAALEAAGNALSIWGARHARQVEEHYCRKSDADRASGVRSRIETALNAVSYVGLARRLLNMDAGPALRSVPKQTQLEEGPRL